MVAEMDVVPFDGAAAESYGLLANWCALPAAIRARAQLDLLIGATAERHRLSLATRNESST